jgi:hypothetical protein
MLVKIVFFLVCLLITVSCSSISDDGAEVTVPFSQVGEVLIKGALDTPEISSQLTSCSRAILSSIAIQNEYALSFYDFAVQKTIFITSALTQRILKAGTLLSTVLSVIFLVSNLTKPKRSSTK